MTIKTNILYGTADDSTPLYGDVYLPSSPIAAILMVHGGGWHGGTRTWNSNISNLLMQVGFIVLNIDYRVDGGPSGAEALLPGQPGPIFYPAESDDAALGMSFLRRKTKLKVGAFGTSAGTQIVSYLGTNGEPGASKPDAIVTLSCPFDFTIIQTNRNYSQQYAEDIVTYIQDSQDSSKAVDCSLITNVTADFPPCFCANSTDEPIPLQNLTDWDTKLTTLGVDHEIQIVPGTQHAEKLADDCWPRIVPFLKTRLT